MQLHTYVVQVKYGVQFTGADTMRGLEPHYCATRDPLFVAGCDAGPRGRMAEETVPRQNALYR